MSSGFGTIFGMKNIGIHQPTYWSKADFDFEMSTDIED